MNKDYDHKKNFKSKSLSNIFKMQSKQKEEHALVKLCMEELCRKAGFADCRNMVQRDLEFICESIESKTGVLISLSTIRRLFNGQFSRQPQIATLNAIAMFLGYQNWQDVKKNYNAKQTSNHLNKTERKLPNKFVDARFIILCCVVVFAAIGLFAALSNTKPKSNHFEKAQFSFSKTTSNDLPNTVVFYYNVEEVNADSFFIQQSWDKNRRIKIDKKGHTLTDIYYEPGYHVAKLIANDKIIKTLDVSIPTDRWFFYAKEKKTGNKPTYIFPSDNGINGGSLQLNKQEVINSGADVQKENEYIQVFFPSKIENNSDNFVLHFRVRVHELRNEFCPHLMCEVFCQKYFMFFTSSSKGCASEMMAQFGENFLSGKNHDLSPIATNVKEWQDVVVTVKNRKVSIRINNQYLFSTGYQQSCGLITGLGFMSNGLPEVDFVNLQTLDGKTIYSNSFQN